MLRTYDKQTFNTHSRDKSFFLHCLKSGTVKSTKASPSFYESLAGKEVVVPDFLTGRTLVA
jgi:hypothetical protein